MKKIFLLILLSLPLTASAQVPSFPMAFFGDVVIDESPAPIGTIVRVYENNIKLGEVEVMELGVYGYTNPTQQKLLVAEGTGLLTFTVQVPSGQETTGLNTVTYPELTSGTTVEKDLVFNTVLPGPASSGGSSGGGGGGKSKSKTVVTDTEELVLGAATTTVPATDLEKRIALQKQLILLLTQLISLLQQKMLLQ